MQMTDQLSEKLRSVTYRYELNEDPVKSCRSLLQNFVMFATRYMFRPLRAFIGFCINTKLQMLRRFPRFQVATSCFSCGPPDLNLVVTNFMFCINVK